MNRPLIIISISILLSACGDDTATFTPLGKPATKVDVPDVVTVVPVVEDIVINDLPCMITVRGDLPESIRKFEDSCGITEFRNCEYIGMDMYRCTNQAPVIKELPSFGDVPDMNIPEVVVPEPIPPLVIPEPIQEPSTEMIFKPLRAPFGGFDDVEIGTREPMQKPIANSGFIQEPSIRNAIIDNKPILRPIPRPTNTDATTAYVERHDLIIDYDDVSESSVVKFGKLWAHVILNLGGDIWVAGHSDNIAAVLEYVATFYPDVDTRSIKVVTNTNEHDVNTRTYKIIDQYATLMEVDDKNDIDVVIASNSIAAVSHNDGKLVVPDDLYPIGP